MRLTDGGSENTSWYPLASLQVTFSPSSSAAAATLAAAAATLAPSATASADGAPPHPGAAILREPTPALAHACLLCGGRFAMCIGSYGQRSSRGTWSSGPTPADTSARPESPNPQFCTQECEGRFAALVRGQGPAAAAARATAAGSAAAAEAAAAARLAIGVVVRASDRMGGDGRCLRGPQSGKLGTIEEHSPGERKPWKVRLEDGSDYDHYMSLEITPVATGPRPSTGSRVQLSREVEGSCLGSMSDGCVGVVVKEEKDRVPFLVAYGGRKSWFRVMDLAVVADSAEAGEGGGGEAAAAAAVAAVAAAPRVTHLHPLTRDEGVRPGRYCNSCRAMHGAEEHTWWGCLACDFHL